MPRRDENRPLPYGRQSVDEADIAAVAHVLRSEWLTTGPAVAAFEQAVALRAGVPHGVAVSSGTSALLCACQAAGLGAGDDAVVPTLTFAATAAAVRLTGADVRFADIDPVTWCLSAQALEKAVTPKTKAVLPVDFAGQPCDWDSLTDSLSGQGVTTIADAAHALGATYHDRPVGSLADMTCYSFHPVKAVTTGEGGMVVTGSEVLADQLRRLRHQGLHRDQAAFEGSSEAFDGDETAATPAPWYYEVHEPGLNHRLSDVQSALGLSQVNKLDDFLARRTALAERYNSALSDSDLLMTPVVAPGRTSAWHIYVIQLNLAALSSSRRQIFDALRAAGLGVQVHYMPLHLHPYYQKRYGYKRGDFPNAEAYYDRAITLPLFPAMTDTEGDEVIETVLSILENAKR